MTDIKCESCGHIRETTEENPTLVSCKNCGVGASELRYINE